MEAALTVILWLLVAIGVSVTGALMIGMAVILFICLVAWILKLEED